MKERVQRKPAKKTYAFMSSTSKAIDLDDKEAVEELNKQDHSLLAHMLIENGRTSEGLKVLKAKRTKFSIPRIKETVHRHLQLGDFAGGLEYIKSFNGKMPEIIPLEFLIKMHLERESSTEATVATSVISGLEMSFDRRLLDAFRDFYMMSGDKAALRASFDKIHEIIMGQYYSSLSYEDSKYLFKLMPVKQPYLQRMVQVNPLIKRKYYLMYASVFGIHKKDIMRILAVKYSTWAMSIAMFYGWVDESARGVFEVKQGQGPLLLNEDGDWKWGLEDEMRFGRRYEFD